MRDYLSTQHNTFIGSRECVFASMTFIGFLRSSDEFLSINELLTNSHIVCYTFIIDFFKIFRKETLLVGGYKSHFEKAIKVPQIEMFNQQSV